MILHNTGSLAPLICAYHLIPFKEEDKPYTAFKARTNLYQFTRLPFGVTNGVACFQREMMKFVEQNSFKATYVIRVVPLILNGSFPAGYHWQ